MIFSLVNKNLIYKTCVSYIFNRPGVAGAVLQSPLLLIRWVGNSSYVKISSKHLHFQTVRARELKLLEKVHLPQRFECYVSHVTCHMSRVTCHVSHVMCHMSFVTCQVSHEMCHMSCVTCHESHVMFHMPCVTCHVLEIFFWIKLWS